MRTEVLGHGDDVSLELVDGSYTIDVRTVMRTVDGALIGLFCRGRVYRVVAPR